MDRLNSIITWSTLISNSSLIIPLSQSLSLLLKKISTYSSSLLQRTMKKKHHSSKMTCPLSRILTLTNLKTLSTHLLYILNVYRGRIPSSSILQGILRAGGIRNVIDPWETIEYQEILKTRRSLRKQSKLPSSPFLILKSKKLPTKNKDLGNSWAGSTNTNYQPSKPLNIMINHV